MPSISSYFNPCSKEFTAAEDFKKLSCLEKTVVGFVTALVGLLSASLLATPIFRILVGRFKKLDPEQLPPTPAKVDSVAKDTLPQPPKEEEEAPKENPPKEVVNVKVGDDAGAITITLVEVPDAPSAAPVDPKILAFQKKITALKEKFAKKKLSSQELYTLSLGFPEEPKKAKQASNIKSVTLAMLRIKLKEQKKVYANAIDNGDCFFHAFAQALNIILKKRKQEIVTSVELRQQVAKYVEEHSEEIQKLYVKLHKEKTGNKGLSSDELSSLLKEFDHYKENIGSSASSSPIWGIPTLDGHILCQIYNVNLSYWIAEIKKDKDEDELASIVDRLHTGGEAVIKRFMEKDKSGKWACGNDPTSSVTIDKKFETIEMAAALSHCFPIFKQDDVITTSL